MLGCCGCAGIAVGTARNAPRVCAASRQVAVPSDRCMHAPLRECHYLCYSWSALLTVPLHFSTEGCVTLRVLLKTCGCVFESRTHGFCGYAALFSSCRRHCVQLPSSRVARIPLPVAASRDPGPSFSLAGQGWGSGCMLCWLYLSLTFSRCGCMCLRLHLGAACPYHVVQCSCRTCGSIAQHAGCALFDCW